MKKYEKPSIEVLMVETMNQILQDSPSLSRYDEVGDASNQGAPGRKHYIEDDYKDDGDYGW